VLHVIGQTVSASAASRISLSLTSFACQDATRCSIPTGFGRGAPRLLRRLWKRTFHAHVTYLSRLCAGESELYKILDEARIARNEVAHDVALGFEHWAYDEALMSEQSARIRELATALARADHLLCTLEPIVSHQPMPIGEAYRAYSERLVTWVCNTDNGDPW
jgi:hypothetical protein